jgi:hypothetical protein
VLTPGAVLGCDVLSLNIGSTLTPPAARPGLAVLSRLGRRHRPQQPARAVGHRRRSPHLAA